MPAVDTLFVGGSVFRGTGGDAVAHGVAVADGRMVAVAPDDELRELSRPGTDVVDLAGLLHEGAATLVGRLLPAPTAQDSRAALIAAQAHLLSLGITAWQDAIVGAYLGRPDHLATYLAAEEAGELVVRVVGDLWWDRERGLEQLPELRERRSSAPPGRFRPTTVKIMQDGIAENFTAAMTQPYRDACGCSTGAAGLSFLDPELLRRAVTALDADGFQVHLHTLGDRAVREASDALAAARTANGPDDRRHHLAHLQVVHADDVPRFAALGATATIQPLWAVHEPQMDELTIPFLGEGLAERQYQFAELHAAGVPLAAGSDWAVSSADPWAGLHVAVNRTRRRRPPGCRRSCRTSGCRCGPR